MSMRIADQILRARATIALSILALLTSAVTLITETGSVQTVAYVYLLLLVAQVSVRAYLVQIEQKAIIETTEDTTKKLLDKAEGAAKELQEIKKTTEEELRAEERQNKRLELLFTALKEFNLIEVKSLETLQGPARDIVLPPAPDDRNCGHPRRTLGS